METMVKVRRILWIILFLNLGVAVAKVVFGYLTHSVSMTADGFHSMSDGTSNVIGLIGTWIASHPPDKGHPYGHKKFETFTTVGIAALLLFVTYGVATSAIGRLANPVAVTVTIESFLVMIATMVVNISVYLWEYRAGRRLGSDFLVSDALHTRSDILVSASVLIGLIGVRLGLPWLDSALALVVAGLIGYSAWEIIKNSAQVLCDAAVIEPQAIAPLVTDIPGVVDCHQVRSRGRSDAVYIDLHVLVDPTMTVESAHSLADTVESRLKAQLAGVVDVLVHVEPVNVDAER